MPKHAVHDYLIDTNMIVRLVTGDPPTMGASAEKAFAAAARGQCNLHLTALVVAESIYVLTSFYEVPRQRVVAVLKDVIELPGVRVEEALALTQALELFAETGKLHFVDAYLVARARANRQGVATFDKRIEKMNLVPVLDLRDVGD